MDAHFREYLAAVAGMQEIYGFNDHAGVEVGECPASRGDEPTPGEAAAACVAAS